MSNDRRVETVRPEPEPNSTEKPFVDRTRFAAVGSDGEIYAMHSTLLDSQQFARERLRWGSSGGAYVINLETSQRYELMVDVNHPSLQ